MSNEEEHDSDILHLEHEERYQEEPKHLLYREKGEKKWKGPVTESHLRAAYERATIGNLTRVFSRSWPIGSTMKTVKDFFHGPPSLPSSPATGRTNTNYATPEVKPKDPKLSEEYYYRAPGEKVWRPPKTGEKIKDMILEGELPFDTRLFTAGMNPNKTTTAGEYLGLPPPVSSPHNSGKPQNLSLPPPVSCI